MKAFLSAYVGVGKAAQTSFNKHMPFLLHGPKPPTWQTPGRVQYYRAENEVYLPGKQAKIFTSEHLFTRVVNFYRRDQMANQDAREDCYA